MTSTTTKPSQPRRKNRRGEGQRLREELLAAADAIVTETGDGSALSLRSVAARAGVAATSVYLHFADIDALKAALAQRCFAEFAAARDQAAAGAADPAATLIAGCQAYVRYALDHPGQYRLMRTPSAQISRPYPRPVRPGRPPRSTVRGSSALSRRPHRATAPSTVWSTRFNAANTPASLLPTPTQPGLPCCCGPPCTDRRRCG